MPVIPISITTLAVLPVLWLASLMRNPADLGIDGIEGSEIGQWIREHTDRVNLLLPDHLGDSVLSLLEAFLHVRWKPVFEGRT